MFFKLLPSLEGESANFFYLTKGVKRGEETEILRACASNLKLFFEVQLGQTAWFIKLAL